MFRVAIVINCQDFQSCPLDDSLIFSAEMVTIDDQPISRIVSCNLHGSIAVRWAARGSFQANDFEAFGTKALFHRRGRLGHYENSVASLILAGLGQCKAPHDMAGTNGNVRVSADDQIKGWHHPSCNAFCATSWFITGSAGSLSVKRTASFQPNSSWLPMRSITAR